jgi:DNA-binding XRE family transcriptional regulator
MPRPGTPIAHNLIRPARREHLLTQAELAEQVSREAKCAITKSAISSIETGRRRPGPKIATALCKILDIQESRFITGPTTTWGSK